MIRTSLAVVLVLLLFVAAQAQAQQQDPLPLPNQPLPPGPTALDDHPTTNPPAIQPLGEERFRIGTLVLDRKKREIRVPGVIALQRGTLEYLACAPEGKLYESLLRADVEAYHLHLALLLIGLEPKNTIQFQGDPKQAGGAPVTIEVVWDKDGAPVVHRAEDLVWEVNNRRTMRHTSWVFSGSFFTPDGYAASFTKSIVAVYNDPAATLNNPLPTGGDDTAYVAHTEVLPPQGTEIEIIFRAADKAGA